MFGDSMLADPITQPVARDSQLATVSVWLPPGDWIEWDSGATFQGPVTVQRSFSPAKVTFPNRDSRVIVILACLEFGNDLNVILRDEVKENSGVSLALTAERRFCPLVYKAELDSGQRTLGTLHSGG